MFRYVLAILLINTCYQSLGNPVPQDISTSLTLLGTHCENPFLNNLIKSKLQECSVPLPPFSEKQFQCLIFYDMTTQLCAAIGSTQLVLNEDYTAKIAEEQDVNSLCENAKNWEFKNIGEYKGYKKDMEHALKHPVTCGKVCGAEEIISNDANFFCKYFNWGTAALKTSVATTSQKSINITSSAPASAASTDVKNEPSEQVNDSLDIPIKNTTNEKSKVTETSSASVLEKVSDPVNTDNKQDTNTSTNKEASSSVIAPKAEKIEETKFDEPPVLPENVSGNDQIDKDVENGLLDAKESKKDASHNVLENPKKNPSNDGFDYPDTDGESEEGKDGLIDMQGGDDGDDPMIDDTKANKEQAKADDHKEPSLTSFNRDVVQGDFYHTVQDGYSDGDDDHFFTFFLTAVIMAILLYVLYHNKNKVSKVFFGLLLEGRQPGRRRNSRGHAYRRLDTLEQAMSTNTAAPPSKIIY